jgi:outer membrane biosynthesis protein TonB
MGGAQFRREREPSAETFGSEAMPEGHESETLRTRIAGELRGVDRLQRIARPAALIVFTLLGLLALLQLYTWSRVEQLTALSRRREERVAAALASMQETIDKQRVTLDEATQHLASPGRSHMRADLAARETSEPAAAVAVRELPKPGNTSREPQPAAHKTAARPADLRPAPQPQTAAQPVPVPAPQPDVQPARQSAKIEFQSTASNRLDLAANRTDAAMPSDQGGPARQGGEAGQDGQRDVAEPSGVRVTQADTVIARDHNEVERLRKLGRRDYIEFTLVRSGNRQEVAPDIKLELKKVDSKRLRCAVDIYAEDYEYPTDLGINEPVVFPVRAMWESVELVINKVGKDTVGGYLTARKGVLAAR